jgi:hypothetical protein
MARIWDSVKKIWSEVKAEVEAEIDPLHHADIETGRLLDDEEVRHQAVYDHVTGVESFQPVVVKKGSVSGSEGVSPAAMR